MIPEDGPTSRRRPVGPTPGRLSENETSWLTFLRCIWPDGVPPPSLSMVQAVRLACLHSECVRSWAADPDRSGHGAHCWARKGSGRE